jgi:thimet oligopeptidase
VIRSRLLALAALLLAMTLAPGRCGAAPLVMPADDAPFWTGHPSAVVLKARLDRRLVLARASIARMLAVKGPRTIANTLVPYDEAFRQLEMASAQSGLVAEVLPDAATRDSAEMVTQEVSAYVTELSLNRKVYDALAALDVKNGDPATRYYVEHTLLEFRLAGVDKPDATRGKIKKASDENVLLAQEFDRNIREDKTTITCTPEELAGLPADFVTRHKPGPDGRITLTTEYPDYFPVATYASNADLRKRMFLAYNNVASPKNVDALDRLRAKRHELAQLLGFGTWADYFTADKMVGSASNAHSFIDRVVAASGDRQAREYRQLLAARQKDAPGATGVDLWDVNYYKEQVRKSEYSFDSQQIRPYLPFKNVEKGVLEIASTLFDVQFRRVPDAPVWHPSVECYELIDGGKVAGRFYLDMHPRANKYNHAAQFDIRTGLAGRQVPEAALVCNLPGDTPGDPGLCDLNDVNTFFHEFGHLLHSMFAGRGRWVGVGGITTEQDFVEAPSQMLEEWMRNRDVLATFAKHYQTGEPIPAELVGRMNRANAFAKGLDMRRQMVLAGTSLGCYDRDPKGIEADDVMRELTEKYQPYKFVDGMHFSCRFTHLQNYSAGYYTYMWSKVIAMDLFSKFDSAHLLAPGIAKDYRLKVLAPGGSKPAAELVSDFLGRPFNEQAWKKWLDADE